MYTRVVFLSIKKHTTVETMTEFFFWQLKQIKKSGNDDEKKRFTVIVGTGLVLIDVLSVCFQPLHFTIQ